MTWAQFDTLLGVAHPRQQTESEGTVDDLLMFANAQVA